VVVHRASATFVAGRQVPALLVLTSIGITVRTVVYRLERQHLHLLPPADPRDADHGRRVRPVRADGRPLVQRFASDFCPLTAEVEARPAISVLFRRLTFLWAGLNIAAAAISLTRCC
jgi:hypothetical protein